MIFFFLWFTVGGYTVLPFLTLPISFMLINCVTYQEGRRLSDISVAQISDYVERKDCFVWVALRDADDAELAQMQEEFGLHELAVEDARHGYQRPKIEEYGDSLFAVIHTVEHVLAALTGCGMMSCERP